MNDLVGDHVLDSLTGGLQVLARIEVIGMLVEVLADVAGHSQTDIGVDIDLADSQLSSLPQLILGDADGVGHLAAVLVDGFHIVLVDGACAVEHNRETGQFFFDFFENVKAKLGFLTGFEFIGAVAGADGNRQRIHAGSGDEIVNLFGLGEVCVLCADIDIVFNAGKLTEFALDNNTVCVRIVNDLFGQRHIFLIRQVAAVNHNRGKAAVNAGFAKLIAVAVVKMQRYGKACLLDRSLNQLHEIGMVCVCARTLGHLEDDRSFFPDYNGAFLVREDVLEKYPELEGILNQLAGRIPTEQMAELTYQVDVVGRTVDDVAREFLVSQGLL